MRRGMLIVMMSAFGLAGAAPAGAAQAGMWLDYDTIAPDAGPNWVAGIVGGTASDHVVFNAVSPSPSVDPTSTDVEAGPTVVMITDTGATFEAAAAPNPSA